MLELPRDPAIERAVLSACLLNPDHYQKIRSRLTPDLFSVNRHTQVAEAMDRAFRNGLTPTMQSVLSEIDRDPKLSDDFRGQGEGVHLLAELTIAGIPSTAVETYLKIAEEWAVKRSILKATSELEGMATNGASASDLARVFHTYAKRMERTLSDAQSIRSIDVRAALTTELPPIPWIAEGWCAAGDRVIFAGESGMGKSLVVLDLALSVATGKPWMGKIPILKSGPVLYVDEENPDRVIESRLYRMARGRGIDPQGDVPPIRYLSRNHLTLDRPAGMAALRREIEATRPVLMILDSLVRFMSAEENSNSEVAAFFGECITPLSVEYGCSILMLDHMRKPGKDDSEFDPAHRIRGAGAKLDVGDAAWVIFGKRDEDSRTLQCRKNRSEESLPKPVGTSWVESEDGESAWIECGAPSPQSLSAELAVTMALSQEPGGLLSSDLIDVLVAQGATKRTAFRTVKRLKVAGTIEHRREQGNRIRYWVGVLDVPWGQ